MNYKIVEQVSEKEKEYVRSPACGNDCFCSAFCGYGNRRFPRHLCFRDFCLQGCILSLIYSVRRIMNTRWKTVSLEIDVIYGKKYRKTAHILELSNLETVAPHWHESVARYKKNGGTEKLKKYDYTSYDEDTPYYTMIIREDGHKDKTAS